jgi:hypothetical protein
MMKPVVKVPLKYGVLASLMGVMMMVALYYITRKEGHPFLIPVYFDVRIFLFAIFIFVTLKELRDYHYSGILYFWQGILSSFLFTVMYAVIASAGIGIFVTIVPEFLQSYISLSMEQIRSLPPEVIERIGKEVYQRNLEMLPATNGWDMVLLYTTQSFIISFFISIILSVILRRQPKTKT